MMTWKVRVLAIEDPDDEEPWVICQLSVDHGDGWRIVVGRMQLEVGEYQMFSAGLAIGLSRLDDKNLRVVHEDEVFRAWTRRAT
jgi:hypothetical protein